MKPHPRLASVNLAGIEIRDAIFKAVTKYELTMAEEIRLLAEIIRDNADRCVRSERENPPKKGKGG